MTDRIRCLNPNCRRTAAPEKHPGSTWIICGKCWRVLDPELKRRWKALNARNRKLFRLSRRKAFQDGRNRQWWVISRQYDRAWDRLHSALVAYFTPSEKPTGIEAFLKENGLV